jgi:hypothetical protein
MDTKAANVARNWSRLLKVDHLLHEKPEPEYRFPGKTQLRH